MMSVTHEKPVVLVGAGGHASVLVDCLLESGTTILGVVDSRYSKGDNVLGCNVLGTDEVLMQYSPDEVCLVNGIGMVEFNTVRRDVANKMHRLGYSFVTIVHSRAIVSSSVELEQGVQIMAGAILQPGTSIGVGSIINTGASLDHDCEIGASSHICPGVTLAGNVTVGSEVTVGTGSTVLPGISIGNHSVIAAGSIVYSDVEEGVTLIQKRKTTVESLERK